MEHHIISNGSSNNHVALTPSVGIYDRVVVQDIVKEVPQTTKIASTTQKSFEVIVLSEADPLNRDAQHGLRRTIKKFANNCRLILCCESLSRIIEPLK